MRHLLLAILAFCFVFSAYGQRFNSAGIRSADVVFPHQDHRLVFGENNLSLSLLPIFIQRGFEINYDRRIAERHWLKIAPVFFGKKGNLDINIDDMSQISDIALSDMLRASMFRQVRGWGLKFHHKYFVYTNPNRKRGLFFSYGPGFRRFNMKTWEIKITETAWENERLLFDRIFLEALVGFRRVFLDVFYFEIYGGIQTNWINIRNSDADRGYEMWNTYFGPRSPYGMLGRYGRIGIGEGNYGRSGHMLTFGFNLGILF